MQVRLRTQVITFCALGDSALEIKLGSASETGVLERIQVLASALRKETALWIIDILPVYGTVAVFYNPIKMPPGTASPYEFACTWIKVLAVKSGVLARRTPTLNKRAKPVEIPVCYDKSLGQDLESVAAKAKLSIEALIKLHTSVTYHVHAVGFAPGFPYLAGLSSKLHTPRLQTPRQKVPAGSVGIGGDHTGVYPFSTPGGWNLIGQTPLTLFDITWDSPALLHVGDQVIFKAISKEEFSIWK
ncbi:MAG: 5-oxoprolinase subunit PxpB [Verrucomicrobiota bacterium]|jgi:inhibitor of KinA